MEYGPFIILAKFSLLLAVLIIRKLVKDKKRTNQVFDTSLLSNATISFNERIYTTINKSLVMNSYL
ncbi:hypothetical protein HDU92_000627, partial [Lobulomyces angularis]